MSLGNLEEVKWTVRNIIRKFDYEKREINQPLLKKLKDLIKRDEQLVPELVDCVFTHLRSQDSDKRVCVVLLVDYFFQRSHAFRTAIVDSLQDFLVYTVELDPLYFPLPGPPQAATLLKKETLQIFKLWVEKFVAGYPKLENAKTVLLSSRTFNFARSDGQTDVERRRNEMERIRKEAVDKKIIDEVTTDFGDSKAHVKDLITEARTTISLLIPDFRECDNPQSSDASSSASSKSNMISRNLVISVPDKIIVEQTEDNEELIRIFKDSKKLLDVNIKKVNKWISQMTKHGGTGNVLKEMLAIQRNLNQELQKFKDIKIIERRQALITRTSDAMEDSDSDEDGFEEVDLNIADPEGLELDEETSKNGTKEVSVERELIEHIAEMKKKESLKKLKKSADEPSTSKPVIPTLSFGLDLKYWGEDVEPAEVAKNRSDGHRFWRPPDENEVGQESEEVYRQRVITFVGEMPDITRSCRTPLPSGRLCPRMDRVNCPLHGPIVDRDEEGKVVGGGKANNSPTHFERMRAKHEKQRQEAEDDALYRELEKQTGGKFSYDIAKGKKKRANAPKKREKTAHQKTRLRLKTKLFNKRSLKRVTDTLDAIQQSKAAKKFAHQFNYS